MAGRLLGLDVGQKRTGIAVASTAARLAQPVATVPTEDVVEAIERLAAEEAVEAIVIGLPRSLDGNDTGQTQWVRDWVKNIKNSLKQPLFWQDEALTTSVAASRKLKSSHLDSEAASIILQDWLDSEDETKVNC